MEIIGRWYLDDSRTKVVEQDEVCFTATGTFDGDSAFASRWSFRDGRIFFRTWRIDDESSITKHFSSSTIYSWFTETDEFPLVVEVSEDGEMLMLYTEDGEPRCRLLR